MTRTELYHNKPLTTAQPELDLDADLHITLQCYSGLVNKGWRHLRVMTCLINLIKEGAKDKSVMEERKIRLWC